MAGTRESTAATVGEQAHGPLLQARNLVQEFAARGAAGARRGVVHALSDVSFDLHRGEVLAVVGESGSGKSTLARSLLCAPRPKSGEVIIDGIDITKLGRRELRDVHQRMQLIYQDPFGSLNPRWRITEIVEEHLVNFRVGTRSERRARAAEMLALVGLDVSALGRRRPRELSGGQCQRVAIARALTLTPDLLICDEVVSSLDVLIQAQILNLFERLRTELGLTYLFIAHDLATVKQVSDRVAVMYLGKIAEIGSASAIYEKPRHPYTAALLSSIPQVTQGGRRRAAAGAIKGEPASAIAPPTGCRFRTRCARAQAICETEEPRLREVDGRSVACHFPL